jgi:phage-related baseplate assembly protein
MEITHFVIASAYFVIASAAKQSPTTWTASRLRFARDRSDGERGPAYFVIASTAKQSSTRWTASRLRFARDRSDGE